MKTISDYPRLSKIWHSKNKINPNSINVFSKNKYYWFCELCNEGYSHATAKARLNQNVQSKCAPCKKKSFNSKRISLKLNSNIHFSQKYPILMEMYSPSNLKNIYEINKQDKVQWLCKEEKHGFERSIKMMIKLNNSCPVCSNRMIVQSINDLSTTHPEALKFWNFNKNEISPQAVSYGSGKKVYWHCLNFKHESYSSIKNKINRLYDCKQCSYSRSSLENKVLKELKSFYSGAIICNSKPITTQFNKKLELDILLPDLGIAFEVQDFWTHSKTRNDEYFNISGKKILKKGPDYHDNKNQLAQAQLGIKVYEIWEDEIKDSTFVLSIKNIVSAAH